MIQSREKLADMRARYECIELVEFCVRHGLVDDAKIFGEISVWYAERIKKDDYAALDKKWALYHKLHDTI